MTQTSFHDGDHTPVLMATSSADGVSPVLVWADPITHRLLVSVSGLIISNLQQEIPASQPDGSTTSFAVVNNPVLVILGGAVQEKGVDYTVTGAYTINFIIPPSAGTALYTIYGSGSAGGAGTWYSVSGTINGINPTFTLPVTPGSDFMLILGGQTQIKNKWYLVSGSTITYQSGYIPIGVPSNEHMAFVIS